MTARHLEKIALPAVRGRYEENIDLSPHVWFGTAGPADILFTPEDEADLAFLLKELPPDIPVTTIGAGSNILVRKGGIRGVVVRLSGSAFQQITVEDNQITAGAGVRDMALARKARDEGKAGLEFYIGIPGTVGGAVFMNAGAFGAETAERLLSFRALDRQGLAHTIKREQMDFSYRHSGLAAGFIVTRASFQTRPGNRDDIAQAMKDIVRQRGENQPKGVKTGGSTFKNPPGQKSWKLIEEAGCRGLTVEDAQMSPHHCNFMINRGKATPDALERLGETVRKKVHAQSGVQLEWEIQRLGDPKKKG